jgi:hypothetical protein
MIACTLGSDELGRPVERWKVLYADAGIARAATDEGVRVRFRRDPRVERELRELVAVEVECCAWAAWTVEAGDELVLEIGSTGDGVAVIHGWFLDQAA